MKRMSRLLASSLVLVSVLSYAQLDKIVIPAGTPEDLALSEIGKEQDVQKRTALYQEFLQKFSSNTAAVTYGNWQLSQTYQNNGDLAKALEYGDKAVAGSPRNLDILVSQANIAQQMKNDAKILEYSVRGGEAYNSIAKQPPPQGISDQDFAVRVQEEKNSVKNSYDFLEAAGFNAITDEKDPKARMSYIERYTAAYPECKYADQVAQYAMYTLGPGQLNDPARLVAFGDKALATNPNSIPALLLLSNFYVEDSKPASIGKAASYAQKVIELAKADAPDADKSRKLSAGVAHSTLGYALMKQDKTAASIPQLKSALELLNGQDDTAYAAALYRLGYAYAKTNKVSEAREVLEQAIKIEGPVQRPAQELLTKVNSARAKSK